MLAGENRPHGMSDGKTCCRKKPDGEGGQVVRMEAGGGGVAVLSRGWR